MIQTKIRLSPSELELAGDAAIILTKNSILQKTKLLFEDIQQEMQRVSGAGAVTNMSLFEVLPKISRGEQYQGLPWLVLDYPRIFRSEDIFTIRTLFWWGHFFSSTLQLSGSHKRMYEEQISDRYELLAMKNFFVSLNDDPWQHHFERNNYIPIAELNAAEFKKRLRSSEHIKIAAKWPLDDWQFAANELFACWLFYLEMLDLITS